MIVVHLLAFLSFVASYLFALQLVLGHGSNSSDVLRWAVFLSSVVTAIPALAFWGMTFALFRWLRWRATVLLAIVAVAIPIYFGGLVAPGWIAFFQAMVVAAIAHQLILLLGTQAIKTQWPSPPV